MGVMSCPSMVPRKNWVAFDIVGVQNKSLQDVLLWFADCFQLKATLAMGSREISAPPLTT